MKLIEILRNQLIAKSITHKNQYGREVTLQVEDVIFKRESYDLEPATRENDWYPRSAEKITFKIKFSDGSSIDVDFDQELIIK